MAEEPVRFRASRAESMPEALRVGFWGCDEEEAEEGASSAERSRVPREVG